MFDSVLKTRLWRAPYLWLTILQLWFGSTQASDVIRATTFSDCGPGQAQIEITAFSFAFSKFDKHLSFTVAGKSNESASVDAIININAYGMDAYTKRMDPCSREYNISSLCPLNAGPFSARGNVVIPQAILHDIPTLAFEIPDLQGFVTFSLVERAGVRNLTCIRAPVSNGQSLASPKVQAITGTVAAGALVVSSVISIAASLTATTSVGSMGATSVTTTTPFMNTSPNVGDVFMWFQAVGLTGVFTVAYPAISHSFYKNFGWATGLIEWRTMQQSIDSFREKTGGNLTSSSSKMLDDSQLLFPTSHADRVKSQHTRRAASDETKQTTLAQGRAKLDRVVSGIDAFSEQLRIPSQNTFMTILVIFMLIEASLVVLSAIAKLVFDLLARHHRLPNFFEQFRQNFWSSLAGLLLRSLLIIYGTWCLFCMYQLKNGDSWAASLLAATSLVLFNGIIIFLIYRIVHIALHANKHGEKGRDLLFEHKPYLQKYGVLYDQFRVWWFFIPCIIYSFVKALIIALASNHGMVQIIGCIVLEMLLLVLLCWKQAYDSLQANIVNISISIVRLISLFGTLLFVDILALKETTKTVAGIAVIVVQSVMTGILVILIICNAVLPLLKKKKHKVPAEPDETIPLNSIHEEDGTVTAYRRSSDIVTTDMHKDIHNDRHEECEDALASTPGRSNEHLRGGNVVQPLLPPSYKQDQAT